jgi:branched-chain amino acid transport system ATP-binding protein
MLISERHKVPLLEVRDVYASYGEIEALHGVSLDVGEGEIVTLLGANGAGKTTTLRAITGAIKRRGTIRFAGKSLNRCRPEDAAAFGIAHVPEGRGTLAQFTVRENLELGAYLIHSQHVVRTRIERVLEWFPQLAPRQSQGAGTLSGGEQQMLAIGRALMMAPRLILLDEPSLGLAPLVVRSIFALLREINERDGATILVAEQNAAVALGVASRAYALETGRVVVSGGSDALIGDNRLREVYLGT